MEKSNLVPMPTVEAIQYVLDYFEISTKQKLAEILSNEMLTVQPIQITNYCNGRKMSAKVAARFEELFDLEITDVHKPTGRKPKDDALSTPN